MAYSETLAQRIRGVLPPTLDFTEKKMFGGIAFMLNGNMCCGIVKESLMARVGAENHDAALAMADAGLGVAIVPGTVVQHSQYRRLALRPLVDPVVERDVAVVSKRDRELPPAALSLTQMLIDEPADHINPRRS